MPEKSREFAGNRALNLLWQRDYVRLHSKKQQFSVFAWFDRNFAFKCFLGDFHYNIEYLKIKKFHAHTVSNDGSFVAVTVQIVCSLSYPSSSYYHFFIPFSILSKLNVVRPILHTFSLKIVLFECLSSSLSYVFYRMIENCSMIAGILTFMGM